MSQQDIGEIENVEHISAEDGENINAKRGGIYVYDTVTNPNQWRRASCDSEGNLEIDLV